MRWVFFVLVFLNVAMLVWRFGLGLPVRYQAPSSEPEFSVPTGIEPVFLLSEKEQAKQAASASAPVEKPLCSVVGPFADKSGADILVERLAVLDVFAQSERRGVAAGETYWVYLDGLPSREAARQKLAQLQGQGVDSYIIPRGDMANNISLGVFSELPLAQARMAELVGLGLQSKLKSVSRSYDEFWVVVDRAEVQKVSEDRWKTMINEEFRLQEKQIFCLDVASSENFP